MKPKITKHLIVKFKDYLLEAEKSYATSEKYIRDISAFFAWADKREMNKNLILQYKQKLISEYAPASVNSMLSSLNSFFDFCGWSEYKVKTIKLQKQIFRSKEMELTKCEYNKLLIAAQGLKCKRLYYLLQAICSTGIRVSELRFITVEAVRRRQAIINCKGKMRVILLPEKLCKILMFYIWQQNIKKGSVFITKSGKPLDRSNIWSDMKKLCAMAGVKSNKVYPHNLRHLFARTYYSIQRDVVRLADILGHSNINTTRIYTMENSEIHRKQIEMLGLLKC